MQLGNGAYALRSGIGAASLVIAPAADCDRLVAAPVRLSISGLRDRLHILSAASICFARGVNDTPEYRADWGFGEWAPFITDWSRDLYRAPEHD